MRAVSISPLCLAAVLLVGCPTPPPATSYNGTITETNATKVARKTAPPLSSACSAAQSDSLKNAYQIGGGTQGMTARIPAGTVYQMDGGDCVVATSLTMVSMSHGNLAIAYAASAQVIEVSNSVSLKVPAQVTIPGK